MASPIGLRLNLRSMIESIVQLVGGDHLWQRGTICGGVTCPGGTSCSAPSGPGGTKYSCSNWSGGTDFGGTGCSMTGPAASE